MIRRVILLFILCATVLQQVLANVFPVEFIDINENVTIHRSYEIFGNYRTPSNGLIIQTDKSVILIDTAWNDEETQEVLNYIKQKIRKQIVSCIITHFHQDRCGGVGVIYKNSIPLYMTEQTNGLLNKLQQKYEYIKLNGEVLRFDQVSLNVKYFGSAHSPDNIVVYDERDKLLFGGCLIKSIDSRSIGNKSDANIKNWPIVLGKIKNEYSKFKIVIPGHGNHGGMELLDHTLKLLKEEND
jgi:metallo-beta-lactamase class B